MTILPSPPYFATPPLLYFAHPVSGGATGTPAEIEAAVQANLARARRWVNFLLHAMPDVALELSWLSYIEALSEGQVHRDRGLRDDEINARRCDGIILCGGMMTNGMMREYDSVRAGIRARFDAALGTDLPISMDAILIDLLPRPGDPTWGVEPPWTVDRTTGTLPPGLEPLRIRREIARRSVLL